MKKFLFFFILAIFLGFGFIYFKKTEQVKTKIGDISQDIPKIIEAVIPQPTKILDTGLPDQHLIRTAFIPQSPKKNWDQPWQDACEEAALLTVDYYYKNQQPSADQIEQAVIGIIDFEMQQGWGKDINITQMAAVSSQYLGYKTEIIDNPTIEIIKKYLALDIPVIIPADGKILFRENSHFRSGGPYYHNLVILGYNDTKNQFTVHDVGTQFGAYFRYSYSLLMDSIHDFPDTGRKEDINLGSKKVLVLLK